MPAVPISVARRRATLAKRTLAYGSILAFAVTIGLTRSSHPAHAASTSSNAPATGSNQALPGDDGFGQANIAPATSSQAPSVSTGVS